LFSFIYLDVNDGRIGSAAVASMSRTGRVTYDDWQVDNNKSINQSNKLISEFISDNKDGMPVKYTTGCFNDTVNIT